MSGTRRLKFDEIGYWSEIKLDIVKDYASGLLANSGGAKKTSSLSRVHRCLRGRRLAHLKSNGRTYPRQPHQRASSPTAIDIDRQKVALLRELTKDRRDVQFHQGDCNRILLEKVLPNRGAR
jgi:hypothetical protein